MPIEVTDDSFERDVLDVSGTRPVVVDLWAPWCGPCRSLGPVIEKVVGETEGAVELVKVNIDENPRVAAAFQVQSIPAVFAIRNRNVVDAFVGALGEAAVREFVGRLVDAPSEADQLAALGDEDSLRQALALEPDHEQAVLALADLLSECGEHEEALALLARIPESPETRHLAARARLAASGGVDELASDELDRRLDALLERIPADDAARLEFLDLLEAMEPEDPRRARYRRALSAKAFLNVRPLPPTLPRPLPLCLGERRYDLSARPLVMGIVNRTPDSFYDHGRYFALDASLRLAEELVVAGADLIDIGGVRAGTGPEVSPAEEIERVLPAIEAIGARFDLPLSVDTFRAEVAEAAYRAGAVLGNDISGLADPEYLPVAKRYGASVVATHIRLAPRVEDLDPHYPDDDVVGAVEAFLRDRVQRARAAGLSDDRIILDAGLDLGKTTPQSLELIRASARLAAIGPPLLLAATNQDFLAELLDLGIDERREATMAALALGVTLGCRVLRVHDVPGALRVARTLERLVA